MGTLTPALAAVLALAWFSPQASAADETPQSLQKKCDAKDWSACHTLAYRYADGEGVAKDVAKAAALNEKACNGGYGQACTTLAFIVDDNGQGTDSAKIARLTTRACELKDAGGCYFLGRLYAAGDGVPKDVGRSVKLFEQACGGGEGDACMDLYLIYADGKGVAKDQEKADAFYEKGCDLESMICILGFNLSLEPAVEGCKAGKAQACATLGNYHLVGEAYLKPDEVTAAPFLLKGCDGGIAAACGDLGWIYHQGKQTKKDLPKAAGLYQKGCTSGNAYSCKQLGILYTLGQGVPVDGRRAAELFQTACDAKQPDAFACSLLAQSYTEGFGVPKDPARAAALATKACRLRGVEGCGGSETPATTAPAAAATPALPASLKDAVVGCPVGGLHIGNVTAADIQYDITRRGGSASKGTNNGKPTLNAMSGNYSDLGAAVMSVNYTFDAAGPSAKAIGVTVVNHANSNDEYAKLLAARKAATDATAKNPKCTVRLVPNADSWFIYEFYELKK